ncbi:uncharacterized protein GGS22DRAFT_68977 [Annulohypoxylon maeteangense]|uniref:uncharacterized protein n=1 Tax=Annulohypoxylon maeteangense TaxID=1927788 RepID=UPI0020077F78|nr:uncharacterized protein GGS22DRAFT_68977 [Annulohypoxylon maeteangense]KAI0889235.1 hypothetical protein GGS22DRAFT_68977 [Annulohypoxylon maeteangense]
MRAFATSFVFPAVALAAAITQRSVPEGPWSAGIWRMPTQDGEPMFTGDGINANGGKFFVNRNASTYCPDTVEELDCSAYPGTRTVFSGGNNTVFLDVAVPGGQQVYVDVDGSLSYTVPHSAYMPEGSNATGWSRSMSQAFGAPIILSNNNKFWAICPVTEGLPKERTYQVFVGQSKEGCLNTEVRTYTYTSSGPNAWEYV